MRLYSIDGSEQRGFRLWDNDPNAAENVQQAQPWAKYASSGALELAQITPYENNLLLVPSATTQPILVLNEQGIVRSIDVHLPNGLYLDSVLDSSSVPWMVRTFGQVQGDKSSMYPGPVIAINPFDGAVEKVITWPDKTTKIFCEKDGSFLGLAVNEQLGVFEERIGRIQK